MSFCSLCGDRKIPGLVCCDELIAEQQYLDENTCRYCRTSYESEAAVRACERICARNRDDYEDH